MIRALIFDCFGVFYSDPVIAYLRDAKTPASQAKAMRELEVQGDVGAISKAEFVEQAAVLLNRPPEEMERRFFHGLDRNQELIDFTQQLRGKYRIALLSNIGGDMMDGYFTPADRQRLFDVVILSGDVRMIKPDPAIFRLACERLGVEPREAVMIDDVASNVEAAKNLGMQGICYADFEQFKAELRHAV